MGSGRDKRKKREDPGKARERAVRQKNKELRGQKEAEEEPDRYNNEENLEVTVSRLRKAQAKVKSVSEKNVAPPSPRVNGVLVTHPTRDNELMLFGGELWDGQVSAIYDDLYVYNTKKHAWTQIIAGKGPSPRSSAQGFTYKQYLFIHGGEYASRSQSQFMHFKDVYRFDVNLCVWEELASLKGGPCSRSGHRIVPWRKNALVFGGFYDNALETRYFNDLWVLSQLDTVGQWAEISVPTHTESPHPRSGHCLGLHDDTLFVYGGFSTEKASRFKRAEATVHHDLWCMNLSGYGVLGGPPVMWHRVKMAGIPPPIRSGVSMTTFGKRMLLFGGVVDLDSTGGKTVSTFYNDLFAFHMDTKRFFPMVLQKPKKALKKVILTAKESDSSSESESSGDELDDGLDFDDELAKEDDTTAKELPKVSYEQDPVTLQVMPFKRMDAMLCVDGHTMYVYGGLLEDGKKETTMNDLYSINLNRMESYEVHHSMDLSEARWMGEESGSEGAGSWESGSTVMSEDYMGRISDEELEEEEFEGTAAVPSNVDLKAALANGAGGDDEDENTNNDIGEAPPMAVALDDIPLGRTSVKGKKGMKLHKEQLESQLGAKSSIPTPSSETEPFKDFFTRTEEFWLNTSFDSYVELQKATEGGADVPVAYKDLPEKEQRRVKIDAMRFSRLRYNEAIDLMRQLAVVEARQKEEIEYFTKLREAKKKYEEEAAAREAAEESEEEEDPKDE